MRTNHTPTTYNAKKGGPTQARSVRKPKCIDYDAYGKRIVTEKTWLAVTDLHLGFRDQRPGFVNALLVLDREPRGT